jgi:hypothetical protein
MLRLHLYILLAGQVYQYAVVGFQLHHTEKNAIWWSHGKKCHLVEYIYTQLNHFTPDLDSSASSILPNTITVHGAAEPLRVLSDELPFVGQVGRHRSCVPPRGGRPLTVDRAFDR